jgi:outer membrane immunogenic protein
MDAAACGVRTNLRGPEQMKKILPATVALWALASPAVGADIGGRPYYNTTPPPAYAPIYNWTGFYIGGHLGGAFSSSNNFDGLALSDNSARLLGGVQGGFDWQFHPSWVVGVEGQYSWVGGNQLNAAFPPGFIYNNDQRAIASITARLGWTWGPGLLYVKGGFAHSDNRQTLTTFGGAPVPFVLDQDPSNGFTIGGGVEYMFAPNWSAKAEYQFYDFGDARFLAPGALVPLGSFQNEEHTFKAGINYRFNFGAPLAARY